MRTSDLDYDLPPERIATAPAEPRDAARLLVCHRDTGRVEDRTVADLPALGVLRPGDLMLVNRTRVIPAMLTATRAATGGRVTGLYLGSDSQGLWQVMLESRGTLQPGERLTLDGRASLTLVQAMGGGQWQATLDADAAMLDVLARVGRTPLPPYIRRQRKAMGLAEIQHDDPQRYNTVFADAPGSVAAPTAGLHFTDRLLAQLDALQIRRGAVTLHVGQGTFLPVRTDDLDAHPIHSEMIDVGRATVEAIEATRQAGGRILCVGTTTVRAVESLPEPIAPFAGPTDLFITPTRVARGAFAWRFTDLLLTNFHLPRSTLLALVAALPGVGMDRLIGWYRHAIAHNYRFYSYGDAMLIV